jgi:hypothetical protein
MTTRSRRGSCACSSTATLSARNPGHRGMRRGGSGGWKTAARGGRAWPLRSSPEGSIDSKTADDTILGDRTRSLSRPSTPSWSCGRWCSKGTCRRRESERMDRALFTVIDGYDGQKMMQGISWCWTEGRTFADFLVSAIHRRSSNKIDFD